MQNIIGVIQNPLPGKISVFHILYNTTMTKEPG
jgi:hypothetical protein